MEDFIDQLAAQLFVIVALVLINEMIRGRAGYMECVSWTVLIVVYSINYFPTADEAFPVISTWKPHLIIFRFYLEAFMLGRAFARRVPT